MRRIEWIALGLVCLTALLLQIVLYRNSGAIWRDEASTVLIASAPTVKTMWNWLAKDSAPGLVYSLVRLWHLAGPEGNEAWLRLFGTLVWFGMITSLWVTCRVLGRRPPLLAAALFAFNPTLFYYGSSLRSYGLAVLLIMPCCAAFWRVVQNPTRANVAAGLVLAILSCHASYQNSYVVFALGMAAATCCIVSRLWNRGLLVLAIGFVAGLSMLVYARVTAEYRDVSMIATFDIPGATIGSRFLVAIADGNLSLLVVWGMLLSGAAAWIVRRTMREVRAERATPSLGLYFLVILAVAFVAGYAFIRAYGSYPNAWHFMPLLAVAAIIIEISLQPLSAPASAAIVRLIAAALIVGVSFVPLWREAYLRRTNLDLMCSLLENQASTEDLILLNPFWIAPGFKYHYHGRTEWNTLPLTSITLEASVFPFAPIKKVMASPESIQPTLAKIGNTLARGNRVWIVGGIEIAKPGFVPLTLNPAPKSPFGWNSIVYTMMWTQQVGVFLASHMGSASRVPVEIEQAVNPLENPMLMVLEGWKP